jgi:4a-hydroxytetrahydrobiopterin dehydratase
MTMSEPVTAGQFHASEGLEDWRVLAEGALIFFRTDAFAESARLMQAIGEIPGIDDHPPAVDVRAGGVTVRLISVTDDYFGMTDRDVEVARRIVDVARRAGVAADPSALQSWLIVPGAPDIAAVMPFWRAVLGYEPRPDSPDEDLVDPQDRGPAVWLEQMAQPRADGGGAIHVAVWVPPEQAEARVAAALAAGGRMVRDDFAPTWWTLADAAGNEADIATITGRD